MNENYPHPAMPEGAEEGILRGMYLLRERRATARAVQLLGSGTILREVLGRRRPAARRTSASRPTSGASRRSPSCAATASRPSAGTACTPARSRGARSSQRVARRARRPGRRRDRLHPRVRRPDPAVGRRRRTRVLGTDGFGRSDYRATLRRFFEVDRHHVAVAALRRARRSDEDARSRRSSSYEIDAEADGAVAAGDARSTVPDIGDFDDVPVIEVLVGPGDSVADGGPAGHARVRQGDDGRARAVRGRRRGAAGRRSATRSSEGTPLLTIEVDGAAPAPSERRADAEPRGRPRPPRRGAGRAPQAASAPRPRAAAPTAAPPSAAADATATPVYASPSRAPARARARHRPRDASRAPAARAGSPRRTSRRRRAPPAAAGGRRRASSLAPWPQVDFAKYGEVERVPLSRIQQICGAEPGPQLGDDPARHPQRRGRHHRARGVPQAAQRRAVRRQGDDGRAAAEGVRRPRCRRSRDFNSSLDGDELVLKRYYHLGFAADTPQRPRRPGDQATSTARACSRSPAS